MSKFVSRAGEKLDAALDAFGLDVSGCVCADFGCNVGGFTDCLLHRGAAKVYAVDTGYGELAWKLRRDERVVVMERTNALYCPVPEPVDLVVIDVAWTPQALVVPAAARWLKQSASPGHTWRQTTAAMPPDTVAAAPHAAAMPPRIISLLKPHYELAKLAGRKPHKVLDGKESGEVCQEVCRRLRQGGYAVSAVLPSVLLGKGGNREFILLLEVPAAGA